MAYEEQSKIVVEFLDEIKNNLPEVFTFIKEETLGAATGLEYHGMLGKAVRSAFDKGLIPSTYKEKIARLEESIDFMFTSR